MRGTQWGFVFLGTRSGKGTTLSATSDAGFFFDGLRCAPGFTSDALGQDGRSTVVAVGINAMQTHEGHGTPTAAAIVQTSGGSEVQVPGTPLVNGARLADLDNDGKLDLVMAALEFSDVHQCGEDHVEAGSLSCVGDVLGSNRAQTISPGTTLYAEGIATGDLHEKTLSRTFVVRACSDGGAQFVVPIPDPAFAGVTRASGVTVSSTLDGSATPLSRGEYAFGQAGRLLYLRGGVSCGAQVTVTYSYSLITDVAVCATDQSCTSTFVSLFVNNGNVVNDR
jgi:hypothetical protein